MLPTEADDKDVMWASDNEKVATVDSTGRVTAHLPERASITATTRDGGFEARCLVEVIPDEAGSNKGGPSQAGTSSLGDTSSQSGASLPDGTSVNPGASSSPEADATTSGLQRTSDSSSVWPWLGLGLVAGTISIITIRKRPTAKGKHAR